MQTRAGVEVELRRFSVEDYERMIGAGILTTADRVELLDGEIVAKGPIGEDHADCVDDLNRFFVRSVGDKARVRIQNPVRMPPGSEPEPDVVLAPPGRGHPAAADVFLLIEVSDSSIERDRKLKLPLYARAGVREVWIIDLPGQTVDVFRNPEPDGSYGQATRHRAGECLYPQALPDLELPLNIVFGP